MSWLFALALGLASQPALPQESDQDAAQDYLGASRVTASLGIRVPDREQASQQVIAQAQELGGWFSEFSTGRVTVRVPTQEVKGLIEGARELGQVVERSFQSDDLSAELVDLHSRLKAREEVLAQYMAVLEKASPKAIVTVEREVTQAVAEIEELKGRIRFLEDRARYAQLSVTFQYQDRAAPVRTGHSSFPWLNSLNVADIISDFEYGQRAARSRARPIAPEGFAAYRKKGRFQAVSPDNVVYRVRRVRHKPKGSMEFWKEAMRTRMVEAGYHLVAEEDIQASGVTGALVELGAANGEQDQTYLLAVFDSGRWLVVVEASGESEVFTARREAVLAAIRGMGL